MRSSVLIGIALLGVSLAQSPGSEAPSDDGPQAYVTIQPDACVAQHPGPELVLPTTVSAASSVEEPLSYTTITTTSTHFVWVTEESRSDDLAAQTTFPAAPMSYVPFTPPLAPLSCDDAPTLTYISETVFETLPASTVTTTSVSTTTVVVDHQSNATSYVYVTLSQTPVTVTSTATVTANPSLVTVTVTDRVTDVRSVTVTASQARATVSVTKIESIGAGKPTNGVLTSASSVARSTTLNVVPVDSVSVTGTPLGSASSTTVLRPTASGGITPVPKPVASGPPIGSTLKTAPSQSTPQGPVSLVPPTSRPASTVHSDSVSPTSHLSTGHSVPLASTTLRTASSLMTAPTGTPTPAPCVTTRNITLNFDNLPANQRGKESPGVPSPYEHFYFSKGWVYGKAASVARAQFPASSGYSMGAYVPSLSPNASAPGSFGILPNDTAVAHGFKTRSLRFGCNGLGAPQDQVCRVLITGIPIEPGVRRHAVEVDIQPCEFANGCALAVVDFGDHMFPALKAMQFRASIGNQTVGWFIDDIDMGVVVNCDAVIRGAGPVRRAPPHGIVRRRSVSYEPYIDTAQ